MKKRLLSVLMVLCMVLTLLPVSAFAAGPGESRIVNSAFENAYNLSQAATCYGQVALGTGDVTDSGTPTVWPTGNLSGATNVTGYGWVHITNSNPGVATVSYTKEGGKLNITFSPGTQSGTTYVSVGVNALYQHDFLGQTNMELNFDYTVTNNAGGSGGDEGGGDTPDAPPFRNNDLDKVTPYPDNTIWIYCTDNSYVHYAGADYLSSFPDGYTVGVAEPYKGGDVDEDGESIPADTYTWKLVVDIDEQYFVDEFNDFGSSRNWGEHILNSSRTGDLKIHFYYNSDTNGWDWVETAPYYIYVDEIPTKFDKEHELYVPVGYSGDMDFYVAVNNTQVSLRNLNVFSADEDTASVTGEISGTTALATITGEKEGDTTVYVTYEYQNGYWYSLAEAITVHVYEPYTLTVEQGETEDFIHTLTLDNRPLNEERIEIESPPTVIDGSDNIQVSQYNGETGWVTTAQEADTGSFDTGAVAFTVTGNNVGSGIVQSTFAFSELVVEGNVNWDAMHKFVDVVNVTVTEPTTPPAEDPTIDSFTKERVAEEPTDVNIDLDGAVVNYGQEVTIPTDGSVTLMYKLTVTGDAGAFYDITDDDAKIVGSNNSSTQDGDGVIHGQIPADGSAIIYVIKTFTAGDIDDNGNLFNTATIEAGTDSDLDDTLDEEDGKNDGKYETSDKGTDATEGDPTTPPTDDPMDDISVDKVVEIPDGKQTAEVGDTLEYTITISNSGDEDATVTVEDIMWGKSGDTVLVNNTPPYVDVSSGSCTVTVPADGNVIIYYTYRVQESDVGDDVSNTVTVSMPDSENGKTDEVTVPVEEPTPDYEALLDNGIRVQCENETTHNCSFRLKDGSYSVAFAEDGETCTVTISAQAYVDDYSGKSQGIHWLADGQSETATVTLNWVNGAWTVEGEKPYVTFMVTCVPDAPTAADLENMDVRLRCEDDRDNHNCRFDVKDGTYKFTQENAFTYTVTIYPEAYLEDYNPRYPAVLHTLKNPEEMDTGKTVTLTWNADTQSWTVPSQVQFDVVCKPEMPQESDLNNAFQVIRVRCVDDRKGHNTAFKLKAGSYEIGEMTYDPDTGYSCELEITVDPYFNDFSQRRRNFGE